MCTIELYGQTLSITAVHKTIAIFSNLYPTQHHLTLLTPMYNLLASSADLAYINCYLSQHAHTAWNEFNRIVCGVPAAQLSPY